MIKMNASVLGSRLFREFDAFGLAFRREALVTLEVEFNAKALELFALSLLFLD
jgi:hypothetical protein